MTKLAIMTFVLSSVALLSKASSDEGAEAAGKSRIGKGKAVLEASEELGVRLSEKAVQSFALAFLPVSASGTLTVPVSALIRFQDFQAVYRLRDGWYRMVEIEPRVQGSTASFTSQDLRPGDKIVTSNGGLVRVVELDVFGPEADACAD